jgi:hypothetical protein
VDNVTVVEVFDGSADLDEPTSNLRHGEVRAFSEGVCQRPVLAQLEDDICVFLKGEGAVELNNVGMVEFGVELEFGDKLYIR